MSPYPKCKILIDVFSNDMNIPNCIIDIILKYHGYPELFLLYDMNLFILNSKSLYNIILKESNTMTNSIRYQPHQYIITNTSIPKYIVNNISSNTAQISSQILSSNKWSMIIQIGHKRLKQYDYNSVETLEPKLTAFHYNISHDTLDFKLPPFPVTNMFKQPSVVYNKTEGLLYAMNINMHSWSADTIGSNPIFDDVSMSRFNNGSKSVFSLNFDVCKYI